MVSFGHSMMGELCCHKVDFPSYIDSTSRQELF
jgi:hypothetical protein